MSESTHEYDRLTVPADLSSLTALQDMVTQAAAQAGLSSSRITDLQVALEEIVVNIVKYAYSNCTGNIEVRCGLRPGPHFFVQCIDQGQPFSLQIPTAEQAQQRLKQLKPGGQGLFLASQLVDDIKYTRENHQNQLTLSIAL
ncbi:MAG: ATP-binding protein [Sedimentisphaerales bacterium]|nr:ATP-binding protein [Sedimentisphaerales bacterium]